MASDPKISNKTKKQAILWLFDEMSEKKREQFETTIKEMPPLKDYINELEKTLKFVDGIPQKYPSNENTQKNRIMVTGKIDNFKMQNSSGKLVSRFFESIEGFLTRWYKLILSSSALIITMLVAWYVFIQAPTLQNSEDIIAESPVSNRPILSKEDNIQSMINDRTLEVSKIRELKDNTGNITVTIKSNPEIFYVGTIEDQLLKNILYYVVRHDSNPGTRLNALKLLATNEFDPTLKDLTINILINEQNPGIRLRAIRILESFETDQTIKNICMKVLLEDDNNVMRMEALSRLSSLNDQDLIPIYQVVAQYDQNEYLRQEAEKQLIRLGDQAPSDT